MMWWTQAIRGCLLCIGAAATPQAVLAAIVLPQAALSVYGQINVTAKHSPSDRPTAGQTPPGAPNIVVILLDDVGFGAASTFGGPAHTPALDRLAAWGLRYNRFHVTALCSPTRAALLSGRNAHRVGFGTITEAARDLPGYNGIWKKNTVMVADVLRRHGYRTAAFGKWHNTPYQEISPVGPFDRWPTGLGFESFYGFMAGEDSQWEPWLLYRNTTPIDPPATPRQGYHLTTDLADEAIRWVQTHASLVPQQPYFLYFAPGATHSPHHVPRAWIEQYRGRFDQGWDQLREETFARQKTLGVIPADAGLTPRPRELPTWASLSGDHRRLFARQMEVYAAFLAHTDHEVGRLIQTVQAGPRGDNTLILYIVGDNGAEGFGGLEGEDDYQKAPVQERLRHVDALGSELFWNEHAAAWGWAMNTPFQGTKFVASHLGGTRVPLIVSWPARITDRGGLRTQFTDVTDVVATIYDVTGIPFPSVVDGVPQRPLDGTSFTYSFDNPMAPSRHRTQLFEQVGNRAIYQDGWVAAARHWLPWVRPYKGTDFEQDRWELYHLETDFSQAHDLAARYPQKLKALQALFDREARKNNVYPLGAGWWSDVKLKKQPSPVAERRAFVYYPGLPRVIVRISDRIAVPDFSQFHRITADVVIPEQGAEGVIMSVGSRYNGFALYVKGDRLVYEHHSAGDMIDVITSPTPLPRGKLVVAYEFRRDATTTGGTGRLYVNGHVVGEGTQGRVVLRGRNPLGVGRAFGSPVSPAFQPPFPFTGTLEKATVELP